MSLIPKLQTALSVAVILAATGTTCVKAQTQAVADKPSTSVVKSIATTSEPKGAEAKPSAPLSSNTGPDQNYEISPDAGNSNVLSASTLVIAPANQPTLPSPQTADADKWQFQITPYLWIAGISGRAGIGNFVANDVSAGITDTSVHLNFGFMGVLDAHKGKLVVLTDLQYSNIGTDNATPGPGFSSLETKFKTFVLDPEVGYRLSENKEKGSFVDVLGGIRYWHLRTDLNFGAGILAAREVTASRGWVDAVVGIRGKTHLSKKWFVSGKGDLGGGGSKFTYQLFGGVGVMVSKKVALIGGYRALHVNYDKNNFLFDMTLHGPLLGFGFKL